MAPPLVERWQVMCVPEAYSLPRNRVCCKEQQQGAQWAPKCKTLLSVGVRPVTPELRVCLQQEGAELEGNLGYIVSSRTL